MSPLTLTISDIVDLVALAGFTLDPAQLLATDPDELEQEITIAPCPAGGLRDDDDTPRHYRHIAYYTDYPDEGAIGLGNPIQPIPPEPIHAHG